MEGKVNARAERPYRPAGTTVKLHASQAGRPLVGHTTTTIDDQDAARAYRLLQERIDRNVTGAPASTAMTRVLRLLFSPDEAHIAGQLPQLITVSALARRLDAPLAEVDERVSDMASRGLVLDFKKGDTRYVMPTPVVIGFFELTFMRARPDMPMEDIAVAFEALFDDEAFVRSIFRGETQIGRSLVREEALPEEQVVEVLDWERATEIVGSATSVAVADCPCRSHARYQGKGCDAPLRTCLSFGATAEMLIGAGISQRLTNDEALAVLQEAKEAGLAQTGDNVRDNVTYMCNCCGCCCGMMRSIKRYEIHNGIVSSNWIATIDLEKCRGCAECAKACPVDAIAVVPSEGRGLRKNWAVLEAERCLGCGVCAEVCRWEAHGMEPREDRPYVPADTFERVALMAVERGKLGDYLLDNVGGHLGRAAAQALHALEQLPPWKAAMAIRPLRSTFLAALVGGLRAGAGRVL